jgi:histidine phosphotransferase ChpT
VTADQVRLAELISVRLSHDLGGLVGSLTGILELVAEAQATPTEEVALATQTAAEVMLRLQLLRAAWGGCPEAMDLAALRTHKLGVVASHRFDLDLSGLAPETVFPPNMARLVLNVLLVAAEAMPRHGVLALSGDAASHVVARISGPNAAWPAGFALCIVDEAEAWAALGDPRHLQAPLTALIARARGMRRSLMMASGTSAGDSPPPLLLAPAYN